MRKPFVYWPHPPYGPGAYFAHPLPLRIEALGDISVQPTTCTTPWRFYGNRAIAECEHMIVVVPDLAAARGESPYA